MRSTLTVSLRRRRHAGDAIDVIHGMVASLQRYRRPPLSSVLSSVRMLRPMPVLALPALPEHAPLLFAITAH